MPISIVCPGCSVQLGLPDEAAGANVGCPRCGARMIVPRPSAPPVSPPPRVEEKKRPVKLVRVPDADEHEVPETPRKKRSSDDKPKRKKNADEDTSGIWIGIAVGACVVIATAIAAVFLSR